MDRSLATPERRVKAVPAPLVVAQELIASGTASPPDDAAVQAPALAVFAVGDPSEVARAMQREQIDALPVRVPRLVILELPGTTHERFMVDRVDAIAAAVTSFLADSRKEGSS